MRRVDWLVGLGALLAASGGYAALMALGACNADFGNCTTFPHAPGCLNYSSGSSSGSTSTGTTTGSSSTSTSSSSGMPTCSGDPTADAGLVSDMCGIFVSSSAPDGGTANGTMEDPFNNLADALVAAQMMNRFIFVCAGKYPLPSTLSIKQGVDIYGNASCTGGAWSLQDPTVEANRTELDGPANEVAVVVSTTTGTVNVSGLNVVAAPATGMGASSIAVYVDTGTTANFTECDIISSTATAGAQGMDAPTTAAMTGGSGNNGNPSCSAGTVQGAAQVANTCGGSTPVSIGGNGGNGESVQGTPGTPGFPASTNAGQAGAGDNGTSGWGCALNNPVTGLGNGTQGADGATGMAGTPGTGFGTLDSTGYVGVVGGDGTDGAPGQGGGGGGGVRGSSSQCTGANNGGASGGSGGAGGCGGAAGKGGQGGGASFALVSANATVTLSSVKVTAGFGGAGGQGGGLQAGGNGGSAGQGGNGGSLANGCNGGGGGKGGSGGPGAGGNGGHSIAIASMGTAPTMDSKSTATASSSMAMGGPGGTNNTASNSGNAGIATACYDYMKGMMLTCQ
jgi:hypothetical protein